jgi:hypothetical protein
MLGHENLSTFFKTNFAMMQFHNYTLHDLNQMIPWERQVYVDMLHTVVKSENERKRDAIAQQQYAIQQHRAATQPKMRPAVQTGKR